MRPMRWSLAASFLIHAAILMAAVVVLPSPDEYQVETEDSIPVEIIDIDEISARQAVSKEAEAKPPEKEKPAPPKIEEAEKPKPAPEPAKEIKEAAREPEAEPAPPEPEPLTELIEAAAEPEPEPEPKKADTKPVPLPKKKPEPPKKTVEKPQPKFNADELAALLNKIDGPKKAPPKPAEEPGQPKLAEFTSLAGSDDRISADAIDWLRQRIERCWNPPVGVRDAEDLVVRLRIELQQSGEVKGVPVVINSSSDPLFEAAAGSAVRAVLSCQPYDGLPADKYQAWRDIILNFDPRRMLAIN